uniref:Uncharacterized protein n=1 Tax=Triticum urartu TaxID=4572 RepID=A0A8R7P4F6_TRIUA
MYLACFPREAVAVRLLRAVGGGSGGAARRHEVAQRPRHLHHDLAPLCRWPLLLGEAAAADVLVLVLHCLWIFFLLLPDSLVLCVLCLCAEARCSL